MSSRTEPRRWRRHAAWLSLLAALCVVSPATRGHAVTRGRNAAPQTAAPMPGEGLAIALARCTTCHGLDLVAQQRLSGSGWAREVDKMIGWGAAIQQSDRTLLIDYLAARFGQPSAGTPAQPSHPGAAIVAARCLSCHGDEIIAQQRLNEAGWTREIDKMTGWGATVADEDRAALIAYLAARRPTTPRP